MAVERADAQLEVQLFYRYVQLADPQAVVTQQWCLCEELGLSGRMRIAFEGINGILCGTSEQLARYREAMKQPGSPLEGLEVQYKLSAAGDDGDPMGGELYVRVCDELTATGLKEHMPTVLGGAGGTHLSAQAFHEALTAPAGAGALASDGANGERRRVVIDTRNHFETAVGSFQGAIDPKIRTFSQFPSWVEVHSRADTPQPPPS